jgi:amino acid transporter
LSVKAQLQAPIQDSSTPDGGVSAVRRRLKLLPLVCVIYLVVSGGAYGLEDAVRLAGPRLTMLLCLVVPLTLSVPTALMAAELTALMPVEGGFYFWVKEALGPFAGFAEVYLTVLYSAVDTAIYPLLFAAYLSFLVPVGRAEQVILAIVLVWAAGWINLAGIRPVGFSSVILGAVLVSPFAALVIAGLPRLLHFVPPAGPLYRSDFAQALGAGLTVVIWNFCGWENVSVVAGELESPRRNYLRAIAFALPMVVAGYLLPLAVSLSGATSTTAWRMGYFSQVGYVLGGPLLGGALAIGGAVMAFAVFEAAMLWVSRIPYVLAREHYLPPALAEFWPATATPGKSIILCCVVFTLLVPLGFLTLVVFDVFFYMAALALEMVAFVKLRRLYPQRERLFMVGGGKLGLYLVALMPLLTWLATFALALSKGDGRWDFLAAIALGTTVWPAYEYSRRRFGGASEAAAPGWQREAGFSGVKQ